MNRVLTTPMTGLAVAAGAVFATARQPATLMPDGGDATFRFRRHIAPQPDGIVVNSVSVSRWGIPLACSRAVFTRAS